MTVAIADQKVPAPEPFKCLAYYEERDAEWFAGRDREIQLIADGVSYERSFVLYGKSGLGKTSLLLAGVFPELRARGFAPIHLRTLADPLGDVYREVAEQAPTGDGPDPPAAGALGARLLDLLRHRSATQPIVLVFDQFEEFFIRFRDRPRPYGEFVDAMGEIVRAGNLRVHVVFSLREEFLADLDDFRIHLPALFSTEYRLRPMGAFGVRAAIVKQFEAAHLPFDPQVVSGLVDLLSKNQFDSVMLQLLSQEVYENAVRRKARVLRLTVQDLQKANDLDTTLHEYMNEMTRSLPLDQQLDARMLMRALVTFEHTKRAVRPDELLGGFYRLDGDQVKGLLDLMERNRLVRKDLRGGEPWFELAHERLATVVEEWLRLDTRYNSLTAAEEWILTQVRLGAWRSSPVHLLPAGYLSRVLRPFGPRLNLSGEEIEFVLCSAIYAEAPREVRYWAERLGSSAALDMLRQMLSSDDAAFRAGAVLSIGAIGAGDQETAHRLREIAWKDSHPVIRVYAALALFEMRAIGAGLIAYLGALGWYISPSGMYAFLKGQDRSSFSASMAGLGRDWRERIVGGAADALDARREAVGASVVAARPQPPTMRPTRR